MTDSTDNGDTPVHPDPLSQTGIQTGMHVSLVPGPLTWLIQPMEVPEEVVRAANLPYNKVFQVWIEHAAGNLRICLAPEALRALYADLGAHVGEAVPGVAGDSPYYGEAVMDGPGPPE